MTEMIQILRPFSPPDARKMDAIGVPQAIPADALPALRKAMEGTVHSAPPCVSLHAVYNAILDVKGSRLSPEGRACIGWDQMCHSVARWAKDTLGAAPPADPTDYFRRLAAVLFDLPAERVTEAEREAAMVVCTSPIVRQFRGVVAVVGPPQEVDAWENAHCMASGANPRLRFRTVDGMMVVSGNRPTDFLGRVINEIVELSDADVAARTYARSCLRNRT